MANGSVQCDIADLLDGRLFAYIMNHPAGQGADVDADLKALREAVGSESTQPIIASGKSTAQAKTNGATPSEVQPQTGEHRLLPFSNDIFDKHLKSIHVKVDSRSLRPEADTARTFKELTHWHNNKPLNPGRKAPLTDWQKGRALRSNAIFQRELHQYAVSLTSSVGKSLDPETIFTGTQGPTVAPTSASADVKKAENAARIAERNEKKFVSAWQSQVKDLEAIKDPRSRYHRAQVYLNGLPADRRLLLGSEVELYLLSILVSTLASMQRDQQVDAERFAALIFDTINRMSKIEPAKTTKAIQRALQLTNDSLGLPFKIPTSAQSDRSLAFQFTLQDKDSSLRLSSSSLDFELTQCGPYLDRSIDSSADERVKFEPDRWQKKGKDSLFPISK